MNAWLKARAVSPTTLDTYCSGTRACVLVATMLQSASLSSIQMLQLLGVK
jgi:hypothetical protein